MVSSAIDHPPSAMLSKLVDRWLLLGTYGPIARLHMVSAWVTVSGFLVVDTVWLWYSRMSLARANLDSIIRLVLFTAIGFGFSGLASHRLTNRVGCALREGARRVELFANAVLVLALLTVVVIVFCCLSTSAGLPLQDARLEQIDKWLGFNWIAFVEFANSSGAGKLLLKAYQSTAVVLIGTMLWFCISGQGSRLAELLGLLCVTSIGIAIGMMILPAAGAYSHYQPLFVSYENFGAGAEMWHYDLLMAFRTGSANVIDFSVPNSNCLVTFPSGHTILAIILTYELRGSRYTLIPASLINGTMLVSTIPEGGHYLFDLIVSGVIAALAISFVRLPQGVRRYRLATCGNVGMVNA